MKNFTPLFDDIMIEYGPVAGTVYGLIWRYSQQKDGICRASLENISKRAGTSRKTVERHVKKLVRDGAIIDLTPGKLHGPHHYKCADNDTGGKSKSLTSEDEAGQSKSLTQVGQKVLPGQSKSLTGSVKKSYPGRSKSLTKIEEKRDTKKDIKTPSQETGQVDVDFGKCVILYQENIGELSPIQVDDFSDVYDALAPPDGETRLEWFEYAILSSANNEKSNWAYTKAILENINEAGGLQAHRSNRNGRTNQANGPPPLTVPPKLTHDQIAALKRLESEDRDIC